MYLITEKYKSTVEAILKNQINKKNSILTISRLLVVVLLLSYSIFLLLLFNIIGIQNKEELIFISMIIFLGSTIILITYNKKFKRVNYNIILLKKHLFELKINYSKKIDKNHINKINEIVKNLTE